MSFRFRPQMDVLEGREVPASLSALLPDGSVVSGQFSTPDGVDPGQVSQVLEVTDLTIIKSGAMYAVQPRATATYQSGVLVGVDAVAVGEADTVVVAGEKASNSTEGGAVASDAADTQSTFELSDGTPGVISFQVPWDRVDPSQVSQTLALGAFNINVAGRNISPTDGVSNFTTPPTITFADGNFAGINFAVNTAALAGSPYASLAATGFGVTGASVNGGVAASGSASFVFINAPIPTNSEIRLDFTKVTPGSDKVQYQIAIDLKDDKGNSLLAKPIIIQVGPTTTATDIMKLIVGAFKGTPLSVTIDDNVLVINAPSNLNLGQVTYTTIGQNGNPAPTTSGPTFDGTVGGISLVVNGKPLNNFVPPKQK